jgi:phenylpropionate dioxygenase-like ring-hydroxylating dioxygenase large terminal subunit
LAVCRGVDGAPVAVRDRCMHRAGRVSKGSVADGCLRCPYHGWTYDGQGSVVAVPAEGAAFRATEARRAVRFATTEQDDYVYVRLAPEADASLRPFAMPDHGRRGWRTVRMQNRFPNTVTNCVENFIDIPHTVFVHPKIFRDARQQQIEATVKQRDGSVVVEYRGETDNLGAFKWFLNPTGAAIRHTDSFHMPNVTSVTYEFGPRRTFHITSQSVPCTDDETLVYTELTYDYGIWNAVAAPIVRRQGQRIIDQDVVELGHQMEVLKKYGGPFANTSADVIHVFVESIRAEIAAGRDPRALTPKERAITFYV